MLMFYFTPAGIAYVSVMNLSAAFEAWWSVVATTLALPLMFSAYQSLNIQSDEADYQLTPRYYQDGIPVAPLSTSHICSVVTQ